MRKITRVALQAKTQGYLEKKQIEVDSGKDPTKAWNAARKTKTISEGVVGTLVLMAGVRARCMFCEDSRGADVEHFWPKVKYPNRTFAWTNMLLVCTACGRKKGDRFELDAANLPLFIDPTAEEPWDFLFFDADTGIITARYNPTTGTPDAKGEHMTAPLVLPINVEAITNGRLRTKRNLRRAITAFFHSVNIGGDPKDACEDLLAAVKDNSDYGLVVWYFLRDGKDDSPFRELKANHPDAWKAVADSLS
jgi:uncharacterized protein (TIGR02646 family)